jgi:4-hydroxy-3-methylbut-2-en-1-yl diphosphate synthase IspG/GcpE
MRCKKSQRKSFLVCPACTRELSALSKLAQEKYKKSGEKGWIPLQRWTK